MENIKAAYTQYNAPEDFHEKSDMKMPQYVAYQKNVAFALFTLSTKSHTFNRYCTIMPFLWP